MKLNYDAQCFGNNPISTISNIKSIATGFELISLIDINNENICDYYPDNTWKDNVYKIIFSKN